MTVYVCFDKDIECGDIPANWCVTCPKRKAAAPAKPMTDHIHTCTPGCTECDRAKALADTLDIGPCSIHTLFDAAAEIRALHAQREALTKEVVRLREAMEGVCMHLGDCGIAEMLRDALEPLI